MALAVGEQQAAGLGQRGAVADGGLGGAGAVYGGLRGADPGNDDLRFGTGSLTPEQTARPTTRPHRLVELGPGRFTAYCRSLGWEWVEYRLEPRPGSYCVMRKGDTMLLSEEQRDEGCRWRYREPNAFHRYKGRANWCFVYR